MTIKNEQNLLNGLLVFLLYIYYIYIFIFAFSNQYHPSVLKKQTKVFPFWKTFKFDISFAPISTLDYQTHFNPINNPLINLCCSINIQ